MIVTDSLIPSREYYTFVVPIRLSPESIELDLDRLLNVAVNSIRKFFDPQLLDRFIIIATSSDLRLIEGRARGLQSFPFDFVDEVNLCSSFGRPDDGLDGTGWQGWHRQQVLKIAAASIVRTPFYITMDDDVVLSKRVQPSDLLRDGRLLLEHISLKEYPQYRPWYRACCNVLKVSDEMFSDHERIMGFTPQIIVTERMRELQNAISRLWNHGRFDETLLQLAGIAIPLTNSKTVNALFRKATGRRAVRSDVSSDVVESTRHWTEHQLYWTFLKSLGITWQTYTTDAPQLSAYGFWQENAPNAAIDAYLTREFTEPHEHFFSVIGSRVKGLDRPYLYRQLAQRLA